MNITHEQGFTLIELLVCAAILVILASIIATLLLDQRDRAEATAATASVKSLAEFVAVGIADGGVRGAINGEVGTLISNTGSVPTGPAAVHVDNAAADYCISQVTASGITVATRDTSGVPYAAQTPCDSPAARPAPIGAPPSPTYGGPLTITISNARWDCDRSWHTPYATGRIVADVTFSGPEHVHWVHTSPWIAEQHPWILAEPEWWPLRTTAIGGLTGSQSGTVELAVGWSQDPAQGWSGPPGPHTFGVRGWVDDPTDIVVSNTVTAALPDDLWSNCVTWPRPR